jgi:hypothetical protein
MVDEPLTAAQGWQNTGLIGDVACGNVYCVSGAIAAKQEYWRD